MLKLTDPLIDKSGKASLKLPFDDFNERSHPKVITETEKSSFTLFRTKFVDNCINFQEFAKAAKILREAYYSDKDDRNATIKANIALMSDLNFADSVLKTVKSQLRANQDTKAIYYMR